MDAAVYIIEFSVNKDKLRFVMTIRAIIANNEGEDKCKQCEEADLAHLECFLMVSGLELWNANCSSQTFKGFLFDVFLVNQ